MEWKRYERYVASRLNAKRIPILGREGADIAAHKLWIDCKKRKMVPSQWEKQLACAETLGYRGILIQYGPREIVATRLDHFIETPEIPHCVMTHVEISDIPIRWLRHIQQSCPPGHMPLVAMLKTGEQYKNSILVFDLNHYLRWQSDTNRTFTAGATYPAAAG